MEPLWPVITPGIAAIHNANAERALKRMERTATPVRAPRHDANLALSSEARATIAAMNHDTIAAGLWALSRFDPALVHLAELREHFARLPEGDQIRITLDRLTSVYVEGQCHELVHAAGITTEEADRLSQDRLPGAYDTTVQILECTDHPLALEICAYAIWLGVLTAHGIAPWKRFAAVMADCHAQLQQAA
jgi:hypothetical protein